MTTGSRALLRDLRAMARTERHSFTGRPIGASLASRLPRLIAGVVRLVEAGAPAAARDPEPDRSILGRRGSTGGDVHGRA